MITDLASQIEGEFTGELKVDEVVLDENYRVEFTKQTSDTVLLNADDCNNIDIFLTVNINTVIFGEADTIDNFNYLVEEQQLQFLINSDEVFKVFEGTKD